METQIRADLFYFSLVLLVFWFECLVEASTGSSEAGISQEAGPRYGADVSFPMTVVRIDPSPELGDRQIIYDKLMHGCIQQYDEAHCRHFEEKRRRRNLHRPSILQNFTEQGFAKIKAPPELWKLVETFWKENAEEKLENWSLEQWAEGESTVNHWEAPTYFVSLFNSTLKGSGPQLEDAVWKASKETLEAWTGQKMRGCSLYGIRIYTAESILHTHVDRVPLISSAIINVAQDTDEPWPLEVIGHDGYAHNITMVPGDMVLYESHSIMHGRPFPLKGRFMANIFVHFEVLAEDNNKRLPYVNYKKVSSSEYRLIMEEYDGHWNKRNQASTVIHNLAGNGRVEDVRRVLTQNPKLVDAEDPQGWTALHEAARGAHLETIHLLLKQGADVNAITNTGSTATYVAERFHGADSIVVRYLEAKGGIRKETLNIPPNLPHRLAGNGLLEQLKAVGQRIPKALHLKDPNGWTPLHEAARGGHQHVFEYLLKNGALLNQQTNDKASPLWYAAYFHGPDSQIYQYIESVGGIFLGPDIKEISTITRMKQSLDV